MTSCEKRHFRQADCPTFNFLLTRSGKRNGFGYACTACAICYPACKRSVLHCLFTLSLSACSTAISGVIISRYVTIIMLTSRGCTSLCGEGYLFLRSHIQSLTSDQIVKPKQIAKVVTKPPRIGLVMISNIFYSSGDWLWYFRHE